MKTKPTFKNKILSGIMALTLSLGGTLSKPSEAIIYSAFGAPLALTVGGLLIAGMGVTVAVAMDKEKKQHPDQPVWREGDGELIGYFFLTVGMIVLDKQKHASINFPEINQAIADNAQINPDEYKAYENEREELTAIGQTIARTLAKSPSPTWEQSQALWKKHALRVSNDAFQAAIKLATLAQKTK